MAPTATAMAALAAQAPAAAPPTSAPTDGQQETIQSFAGRVRAKYPGAYDNQPDDVLVHHFVTKYPVYGDRLAPAEKAKLPDITKTQFDLENKNIDPETYFRIYSSYHPAPPPPTGFWGNVKAEAKNIWQGLTGEPEAVPGLQDAIGRGREMVEAGKSAARMDVPGAISHAVGAVPVVGPPIQARARQIKSGDVSGAVGAGLVDAAAAAAPIVAERTIPAVSRLLGSEAPELRPGEPAGIRQRAAETLARPTLDMTTSAAAKAERYGHVPERAVVGEKVSTSEQAQARMEEVGQELSRQLEQHGDKRVNVGRIINETADAFTDRAGKHGKTGVASAIENARDAYLKNWGDLNKSPKDAAAMKTEIREEAGKFSGTDEATLGVNQFRKAIANGIRDAVNAVTDDPRIRDLNQRYGDLADARDSMKRGELQRSTEGPVKRLREGFEVQAGRKVSQILGKQYPDFPDRPAAPTLQARPGTAPRPAAGAVPAGEEPRALPAMGGTGGGKIRAENPEAPPPPKPLAAGEKPKPGLPAAFSLRGTDLQSEVGPEAAKPLRMRPSSGVPEPGTPERTTLPSSGQTIEAGPSTYKPPTKEAAQKAAAPPPTTNDLRGQLAEMDRRYRDLSDQLTKTRKYESSHRLIGQLRDLSAKRDALREQLGIQKPEAKPFSSITPESKVGQVVPEKPRAPTTKESQTPTFDSLTQREQESLKGYEAEIKHLPQSLREDEEKDLARFGGKGSRRIEQLARRYAQTKGLPVKKTSGEASTVNVMDFLRNREPGEE